MRSLWFDYGVPVLVGVLVFLLAFLGLSGVVAESSQARAVAPTVQPGIALDQGSLAWKLAPGHLAVSVPVVAPAGSADLLRPGDRVDLLATSVPASGGGAGSESLSGTLISGAVVLQPPSGGSAVLLLDVPADASVALAHAVGENVRLTYAVWGANGPPPTLPSLDSAAARQQLGVPTLPPTSGTSVAATPPASTAVAAATPEPTAAALQPGQAAKVQGNGSPTLLLRNSPSEGDTQAAGVADGEVVQVTATAPGWAQVRTSGGASGWLPARNLAPVSPESGA